MKKLTYLKKLIDIMQGERAACTASLDNVDTNVVAVAHNRSKMLGDEIDMLVAIYEAESDPAIANPKNR